jgi:hypothetical protein
MSSVNTERNTMNRILIAALLCLVAACGGGTADDNSDTGDARVDNPTVDCSQGACR